MKKNSFSLYSKNILFKENKTYVTAPGIVEVEGQFIKSVTKFKGAKDISDTQVQECALNKNFKNYSDLLITPAFINSHTHVAMSFFRGILNEKKHSNNVIKDFFFSMERKLTFNDVKAFAKMGAYECLLNGIGLIWDHYYHGLAVAQALAEVGICGVVAPTLQDNSGPGKENWEQGLLDTISIAQNDNFKQKGIYAALGPHATDTVSTSLWQTITNISSSHCLPIHAHVAQTKQEYLFIKKKYSSTPVSYLHSLKVLEKSYKTLLVHSIYLDKNDYQLLNTDKNFLVFCPFSQMIFQHPADILTWEKNGVNWLVGTDCVASNDSMNIQKELKMISGFPSLKKQKKKFVNLSDPHFLLEKIWDKPGSLHSDFCAGTIQPGALANILVWDTKHPSLWPCSQPAKSLAMGDTLGGIFNMCVNGKWLGKDGDYCKSILNSSEYLDSYTEAEARLKNFLS
ncbi:MAG: amidohydrolase family protein [Silvanigrellaceae bacterium]|nr:amidohydrolase family protein [Silvanigrellaceae bacterium]